MVTFVQTWQDSFLETFYFSRSIGDGNIVFPTLGTNASKQFLYGNDLNENVPFAVFLCCIKEMVYKKVLSC